MWFIIVVIGLLLIFIPKLGVWLFFAYLIIQQLNKTPSPPPTPERQLNTSDLADLTLLRLELKQLNDPKKREQLDKHIDELSAKYLADIHAIPDNALWQQRKNSAWRLLNRHLQGELGEPPWQETKPNITPAAEPVKISFTKPAVFIERNIEPAPELTPEPIKPKPIETKPKITFKPIQPKEPTRLERALKTLSGWHSLAIPFLIQNIGWFIGIFCFIAGSMFLVAYSSGYTKNLIAFFSFFIFTLALLFGGYQLRKKRPELIASSYVIFILSVLLIPITHINATQLLFNSNGLGLILFSTLLIGLELTVFYFSVQLISGLINRHLQQQLPLCLISLTACQLLQGILILIPNWYILAIIHGTIFTILSIAVYRFITDWLNTLFIDKNNSVYFITGTLTYTALISFISVSQIATPDGYYGVFILLICCLLFFIDAQLKKWLKQHTYLSYLSFFLYGLSTLGLFISTQNITLNIISLLLAIGLYTFIVIHYLSLTPLSILLASICWLYHLLILRYLPNAAYLIGSIPLLFALQKTADWALKKRQSIYLTLIIYRILYGLLTLLTVWSLLQSNANLIAMLNSATATLSIYYALKNAPESLFKLNLKQILENNPINQQQNLLTTQWFYLIPLLLTATLYFAPRFINDGLQFALSLILLSTLWAVLGLYQFLVLKTGTNTEHYLNSALMTLCVLILPLINLTLPEQSTVLLLASGLMLYISYQLNIRWLFCLVLIAISLAGLLLKMTYYPVPSNGLATIVLGITIWFWLWYQENTKNSQAILLRSELMTQKYLMLPSCYILRNYKLPSRFVLFREVIHIPLEITMLLFWILSLKAILIYLITLPLSVTIIVSSLLITSFSKLICIRYALIRFFFIPIILAFFTIWLLCVYLNCTLNQILLIYAMSCLIFWQLAVYQLKQDFIIRLINSLNKNIITQKSLLLSTIHHTFLYLILITAVIQSFALTGASLIALTTYSLTAIFLWLSAKQDNDTIRRYLALIFLLFSLFNAISLYFHPFYLDGFNKDSYSGLLLGISAFSLSCITLKPTSYRSPATNLGLLLAISSILFQLHLVFNANNIIYLLDYSVLCLAGISIILLNLSFKNITSATLSIFTLLLSALWAIHSLLHSETGFHIGLSLKTPIDLWWTLTFFSGLLIGLTKIKQLDFYKLSLYQVSITALLWSFLGTLLLFFNDRYLGLSILFILQCIISFLLFQSIAVRGFITASFLTLSVLNALSFYFINVELQTAVVLWAYTLYTLPYLAKRYSHYINFSGFSWFGLLLIVFSPIVWQTMDAIIIGFYCLELALYSGLMLRYGDIFAGVSAVVFTIAGFSLNFEFSLFLNILLWCNTELLLIRFWRRINYSSALITAYRYSSDFMLMCFLIFGSLLFFGTLKNYIKTDELLGILLFASLLHLTCIHSLSLFRSVINLNGLIYSALLIFWELNAAFLHLKLPLFLALCCLPLFMVYHWYAWHYQDNIKKTLSYWLQVCADLATLCLFTYSSGELAELLFSLAILIPISIALGFISTSLWILIGSIEILILLHSWQLLWLSNFVLSLLPFYALQLLIFRAVFVFCLKRFCKDEALLKQGTHYALCLILLSLVELIAHGILTKNAIISGYLIWLIAPFDSIAAFISALIIMGLAIIHLRKTPDSLAWYSLSLFIGSVVYYCRLILLGIAPIGLWDTTLFISAAYFLFTAQHFYSSKPLLNIALLMPVLALFTVPLQLESPITSLLLLVSGLFYVWVRRDTQYKLPLYLALLAFNTSIYLWIPVIANSNQLLQIYVIPAALSVLWLLNLHKHELKPSILMNTRLAAISLIYACATVDVFLRAELGIFILAIGLSMLGIILGIALKTRAFLYAGIAFLVLNVLGQLIQFYPEQRLAKALVLMSLGAVIIVSMIWFNIKRIAILAKIEMIHAEIKTWD